MAQDSEFQINGRLTEWRTKVPFVRGCFFNSPTFWLLGSEWYLHFSKLTQEGGNSTPSHDLVVSLIPKVSGGELLQRWTTQTLQTAFTVSTYIEHPTDLSKPLASWESHHIKQRIKTDIWKPLTILSEYNNIKGICSGGEIRIVCLFCGADPSTSGHSEVFRDIESLSSDLSLLLEKTILPDVALECGSHAFLAHRSILAARSEVFRAMLQRGMPEIETGAIQIQDLDVGVFEKLLRYVYTGKTKDLPEGTAADLYVAAVKYAVHSLRTSCTNWIVGNLTVENCTKYLAIAYFHSDNNLGTAVVTFITKNPSVLKTEEWLALSRELPVLANEVLQAYVASTVR